MYYIHTYTHTHVLKVKTSLARSLASLAGEESKKERMKKKLGRIGKKNRKKVDLIREILSQHSFQSEGNFFVLVLCAVQNCQSAPSYIVLPEKKLPEKKKFS